MKILPSPFTPTPLRACALAAMLVLAAAPGRAADHGADAHAPAAKPARAAKASAEDEHAPARASAEPAKAQKPSGKGSEKTAQRETEATAQQIRQVIQSHRSPANGGIVRVSTAATPAHSPATLVATAPVTAAHGAAMAPTPAQGAVAPSSSRDYIKARAAALAGHSPADAGGHEAHWAYEGDNGPQKWGALKPEFNVCAIGKRQSPIHIEETATLPGPAEPLLVEYQPSRGTVVNNGHTIQVDLAGFNTLTVRGSVYRLMQFHFHHPVEEKVNYKGFAMVAHLVHKNEAGQLAVLAVLMDPGASNPLIQKVWTHMPLDTADRVTLPPNLLDMNELLPADRRYYQFIGSLTTPPCTEGVLWLVLKQPMTLGRDQLKLFSTLFPNNARPTQALNGRLVREAQ